jgi:hypothetical protein
MAKLTDSLTFTGTLGNLSAYKMRGQDKIILRRKGGASKAKIKHSPAFENTRRINAEFSGRARASKYIMHALWPLKALADYNIAGPLNALLKPLQEMDSQSPWGQRHVQLSKNPQLLEGFSLNRKTLFESVVRAPIGCALNREALSAQVEIPALMPGINFFTPAWCTWYSIQVVLGIIPDLFFADGQYGLSSGQGAKPVVEVISTDWKAVREPAEAIHLSLSLEQPPPDPGFSLMLSAGIRYGQPGPNGTIEQVRHAGAARVLAVV